MYVEKYTAEEKEFGVEPNNALQEVIDVALKLSNLVELTGRKEPTVM